jgi:membrane protein implicated in regulation of membrane protease activity
MAILQLYLDSPFYWWICAAVALLAIEVATGAELFLWPAVAAGVMAVLAATGVHFLPGMDVGLFAVMTIASTLAARRFRMPKGADINDPLNRLVGMKGAVVTEFQRGAGRVMVEGAEWAAEVDGEVLTLLPGDRVVVAKVLDGGRLQVRAA